jgi:hypothetical protein
MNVVSWECVSSESGRSTFQQSAPFCRTTIRRWKRAGGTAAAPLRFAPWKNGLSGRVLTSRAAAGVIRTPVHNRFDNQVWGAPVATRAACTPTMALTPSLSGCKLLRELRFRRAQLRVVRPVTSPGRARRRAARLRRGKSDRALTVTPSPCDSRDSQQSSR